MSIDLKIERFGAELANRLFADHLVDGFVPHSLDDYSGVESELNDDVVKAVKMHMAFFGSYYARVYRDCYDQFRLNQMDFLIFVMDAFPHQLLGEDVVEVMNKFVSSCAFLMDICLVGIEEGDSNFLNKIHLIWAMFVDLELKEEFYASGGWAELRKYAWIDCEPAYRFMECFNEVSDGGGNVLRHRMDLTAQSLVSISHFVKLVKSELPVGLEWVDFVVKNPTVPAKHMMEEIEDLEVLLMSLKEVLDPFGANEIAYWELIHTAEMVGMEERACMDALACCDFGKYPEFKEVMENKCVDILLKARERVLSGNWKDSLVESTDKTGDEPVIRESRNSGELDGGDRDISSRTASKELPGKGYLLRNCIEHITPSPLLPAFSLPKENEGSKDRVTNSELDSGDRDISSKTASKGLPGKGYLTRNCIEHITPTPLLPAFSLPNERSKDQVANIELDRGNRDISSRTASKELPGKGYLLRNCIEHITPTPLLPAFSLPNENERSKGQVSNIELDSGNQDISSKTVSKSLPGRGYLMRNCIEHITPTPLLPAFSLPNENEGSILFKSPTRENNESILQEPIPEKQSTETGKLSEVEESSSKHSIYNKLMESLQKSFPNLIKSISISEPSEIGQASGKESITLSKVFSVLENSYNKSLRIVVSKGGESEPKSDCSSGLSILPKKKRKTKRNV